MATQTTIPDPHETEQSILNQLNHQQDELIKAQAKQKYWAREARLHEKKINTLRERFIAIRKGNTP